MNKESIYKIIGYTGEYNQSVKKILKRLLKENHPDNKGDPRIFELICEVKDELENNKVSIVIKNKDKKNSKKNNDIDFTYCGEMYHKLEQERKQISRELQEKNELLKEYESEYKELYQKSIDLETKVLNKPYNLKKFNHIKTVSIIMVIILIALFSLVIIQNSMTLFILFVIAAFACILIVQRYFAIVNSLVNNSKKCLKEYVSTIKKIKLLLIKEEKIKKEILSIDKKKKKIENDLRFYKNLLK